MTDPSGRPALWMLAGSFCFAAMGALTHALGPRCDWAVIALVRASVMFVVSVLMAKGAGVPLAVFRPPSLWMRSLAGSFSMVGNFYALTRLPVAVAITLSNAYPLWIFLLATVARRRLPALAETLGLAGGLLGVVLIQQPHLGGDRFAVSVALASSVSSAVAMMGLHRLREVDPRAIMAHFAGVASLAASAWILLVGEGASAFPAFDPTTLLLLAGVGLSGTVGQFFLTRAYAAGPPTRVSVVGMTQVAFALGFDVLLWGRSLSAATLSGFLLVLAPAAFLTARSAGGRSRAPASAPSDPSPATAEVVAEVAVAVPASAKS